MRKSCGADVSSLGKAFVYGHIYCIWLDVLKTFVGFDESMMVRPVCGHIHAWLDRPQEPGCQCGRCLTFEAFLIVFFSCHLSTWGKEARFLEPGIAKVDLSVTRVDQEEFHACITVVQSGCHTVQFSFYLKTKTAQPPFLSSSKGTHLCLNWVTPDPARSCTVK